MSRPDLSLPARIPEMQENHDRTMETFSFALYTLFATDDAELKEILDTATSGDEDMESIKRPEVCQFPGDRLESIVRTHVCSSNESSFDPQYFIVVVSKQWREEGLLLVTLDDDNLECKPDSFFVKPEDAGLLLVNLQMANSDWEETKENYSLGRNDGGGPFNNGNDGDNDDNDPDNGLSEDPPTRDDVGDEDCADYGKLPHCGFHVQVYTTSDVDASPLIEEVEPATYIKKPPDYSCRAFGLDSASADDCLALAVKAHPSRCKKHPSLNRHYFLVADGMFKQDGLVLVHLDWDGDVKARTDEQLENLPSTTPVRTQRVDALEDDDRPAFFTLSLISGGYMKWHPDHPLFAAYPASSSEPAYMSMSSAIDHRWGSRGHGEDRIVIGGSVRPGDRKTKEGFWRAAVLKHLALCEKKRFRPNLEKRYFIVGETEQPQKEVTLVCLDWEGQIDEHEIVKSELAERLTCQKCKGSEAYELLKGVVRDGRPWEGKPILTR